MSINSVPDYRQHSRSPMQSSTGIQARRLFSVSQMAHQERMKHRQLLIQPHGMKILLTGRHFSITTVSLPPLQRHHLRPQPTNRRLLRLPLVPPSHLSLGYSNIQMPFCKTRLMLWLAITSMTPVMTMWQFSGSLSFCLSSARALLNWTLYEM